MLKVACLGGQCLVTYETIGVGYYVQDVNSVEHLCPHLFLHLHSKFTWQICSMFLVVFGIEWVIPGKFREVLECWEAAYLGGLLKKLWRSISIFIT